MVLDIMHSWGRCVERADRQKGDLFLHIGHSCTEEGGWGGNGVRERICGGKGGEGEELGREGSWRERDRL
jgi:hypothetical protein